MQGGMKTFQAGQGKQDKVLTWREMNPFGTPLWEVDGHPLASEEGKPATEWEVENFYTGDNEDAAMLAVWNNIANHEEPYVLFIHHLGEMYKRLDIC